MQVSGVLSNGGSHLVDLLNKTLYTASMEPSGREKITAHDRRNIVLAVLGGETQLEMSRRYSLDPSHISRLVKEARTEPSRKLFWADAALDDAKEEVEFRRKVVELLKEQGSNVGG